MDDQSAVNSAVGAAYEALRETSWPDYAVMDMYLRPWLESEAEAAVADSTMAALVAQQVLVDMGTRMVGDFPSPEALAQWLQVRVVQTVGLFTGYMSTQLLPPPASPVTSRWQFSLLGLPVLLHLPKLGTLPWLIGASAATALATGAAAITITATLPTAMVGLPAQSYPPSFPPPVTTQIALPTPSFKLPAAHATSATPSPTPNDSGAATDHLTALSGTPVTIVTPKHAPPASPTPAAPTPTPPPPAGPPPKPTPPSPPTPSPPPPPCQPGSAAPISNAHHHATDPGAPCHPRPHPPCPSGHAASRSARSCPPPPVPPCHPGPHAPSPSVVGMVACPQPPGPPYEPRPTTGRRRVPQPVATGGPRHSSFDQPASQVPAPRTAGAAVRSEPKSRLQPRGRAKPPRHPGHSGRGATASGTS